MSVGLGFALTKMQSLLPDQSVFTSVRLMLLENELRPESCFSRTYYSLMPFQIHLTNECLLNVLFLTFKNLRLSTVGAASLTLHNY